MTKYLITAATALALLAMPLPFSTSAGASVPATSLVRAGDGTMTCQALASEINQLAAATTSTPPAATAAKPKKKGLGFLGKAISSVAPMASMMVPGVGGMIASSVTGAVSQAASGDAVSRSMEMAEQATEQAMRAMNPGIEQQRKERLMGMFEKKGC